MSKRCNKFERKPRDLYPTPIKAVIPLIPHLGNAKSFIEPCAGDGRLVDHIEELSNMKCALAFDIEPQDAIPEIKQIYLHRDLEKDLKPIDFGPCQIIHKLDALEQHGLSYADLIITNPPWNRKLLHPMIEHFRNQCDTWLLFDSDWSHTKQSSEYMKYCRKIVSVGRVSWMENGTSGMDNCSWYLFQKEKCITEFYGR